MAAVVVALVNASCRGGGSGPALRPLAASRPFRAWPGRGGRGRPRTRLWASTTCMSSTNSSSSRTDGADTSSEVSRAGFPVASPLVDERVLADALALRRDALLPLVCGGRPKWLLRQASLDWLSARVALHPKIGSSDGQLLASVRTHEHDDLLALLGSDTARRAGLHVPTALCDPGAALWGGDAWTRAATLIAWLDTTTPPLPERPTDHRHGNAHRDRGASARRAAHQNRALAGGRAGATEPHRAGGARWKNDASW